MAVALPRTEKYNTDRALESCASGHVILLIGMITEVKRGDTWIQPGNEQAFENLNNVRCCLIARTKQLRE